MPETSFDNKCQILADLWINYRDDEEFQEFVAYSDLGLPLSYSYTNGLVELKDNAKAIIEESFAMLLDGLELEDTGFEDLDDLLGL